MWNSNSVFNTLTPDEKYFLCNPENLRQPIEVQLSKELKIFSNFLLYSWNIHLVSNISRKRMSLIAYAFPKL